MYVLVPMKNLPFPILSLLVGLFLYSLSIPRKRREKRRRLELERIEKERRIEEERRNRMMEEAARRAQITAEIHALERQEAQKKEDARRKKEAEESKFYSALRSRHNL